MAQLRRWFIGRTASHVQVELSVPLLDGTSWPNSQHASRGSFASRILYHNGYRAAFEPSSQEVGSLIEERVLSRLVLDATTEDLPYLLQTLQSAGRIGAGIGLTETPSDARTVDPETISALHEAAAALPAMRAEDQATAIFLLQTGYYLARVGIEAIDEVLTANSLT